MSIVSLPRLDDSNLLAREFALIVANFIEKQNLGEESIPSQIPLENLYRLLEMYRFDAYADEPRNGVLMLDDRDDYEPFETGNKGWQATIVDAMRKCLIEIFPAASSSDAVTQLQGALRSIAQGERMDRTESRQTQAFFNRFSELV